MAIGGDVQLPIGWTRGAPRSKYRRLADGTFEVTAATWPLRTLLRLTGVKQAQRGQLHYETREAGFWVRGVDGSVVEAKSALPSTVRAGEKWMEFSSSRGTFTLYVGRMRSTARS